MERIPDASRQIARPAPDVAASLDAHGRLTIRRRRYGGMRGALGRLMGVSPDFSVHLDVLGTAAWQLLDGRRTIGEVHAELVRRLPGEKDLPARLGKFLSVMASHKMIELH